MHVEVDGNDVGDTVAEAVSCSLPVGGADPGAGDVASINEDVCS